MILALLLSRMPRPDREPEGPTVFLTEAAERLARERDGDESFAGGGTETWRVVEMGDVAAEVALPALRVAAVEPLAVWITPRHVDEGSLVTMDHGETYEVWESPERVREMLGA